ncbi:aspartyl/asparaginyl beta-hydroxylase domain-containing protein [Streptomyces sp. NBC_00829]|uniref:aspartyl/asparaginyl beta-hydroxylase domain-containing protein n=1 Tax=Streptomyces sp. NBC_00829 TaxID=2903679 RepID=UPI00386AB815
MGSDIVKLLPGFDASRLKEELFPLGDKRFNPQATYSKGEIAQSFTDSWRVLSLRGPDGDPERTEPGGLGLVDYASTPLMRQVSHTASVLKSLDVPLRAVRYMTLEPSAAVAEHTLYPYGLPVGSVRLQIPIVTNDQAVLVLEGVETQWQPGELWYANCGRPRHPYNHGSKLFMIAGDTCRARIAVPEGDEAGGGTCRDHALQGRDCGFPGRQAALVGPAPSPCRPDSFRRTPSRRPRRSSQPSAHCAFRMVGSTSRAKGAVSMSSYA